ncbi:hypothetical protein H9Q69_013060 [Fusarium xylarioides]|nr:hypothetical protein H9Q69_013060 [Fusarium xylarioides]
MGLIRWANIWVPVGILSPIGDTVAEGVFGWLAYGINITTTEKVTPAVFRYEDGGHTNPDFGGGGPGGPGGPPPPGASEAEHTTSGTA